MKNTYHSPKIGIILIHANDIISTSPPEKETFVTDSDGNVHLPTIPIG